MIWPGLREFQLSVHQLKEKAMCGGGGGGSPKVQKAPVAPAIVAPIEAEPSAKAASEQERKRRQAASGRSDTILTRGLGLSGEAGTGGKKLLGE
jgi:hypothetical protein